MITYIILAALAAVFTIFAGFVVAFALAARSDARRGQ